MLNSMCFRCILLTLRHKEALSPMLAIPTKWLIFWFEFRFINSLALIGPFQIKFGNADDGSTSSKPAAKKVFLIQILRWLVWYYTMECDLISGYSSYSYSIGLFIPKNSGYVKNTVCYLPGILLRCKSTGGKIKS